MALLRKCTVCNKKLPYGTKCKCEIDKQRESYKLYKSRRNMDEDEKIRQAFYSSSSWLKVRSICISRCYGTDIVCLYKDKRVEDGFVVHHIIELSEDYDRRLDITNLIYVSSSVHKIIHKEYLKSDKHKKAMQRLLFGLLDRFNQEYR